MDRHTVLDRLGRTRYDMLVIGGGITGAGIARDAAMRGMRVALVERADFASGTSSRSSRLIHGGVRYLEYGQLRLVFEASRERRLLLRLAPHLVRPLAFTWPLYAGDRLSPLKLGAGLWLYDVLARFGNVGRHRRLSPSALLDREPALSPTALQGGATYWDAATDDARLTLLTVLGAQEADATVVNHCEVVALRHGGGRVTGADVVDRITGETSTIRADVVVNATGAWTDRILALDEGGPSGRPVVRGTRGTHLLVPRERVGNVDAVTLLSPLDGRVMFVLPSGPHAMLGTTDEHTAAGPDEVRATTTDIDYLLRSVNARFPAAGLTTDDVISAWAGLRPLVAAGQSGSENGADTTPAAGNGSSASREHAISWSPTRLLTITGGKLTTYRSMAEEVVDAAISRLRRRAAASSTDRRPLPGGELLDVSAEETRATEATRDAAVGERLVRAYGSHWRRVWALAETDRVLRERLDPALPFIAAEVVHAATRELACTPGDVLLRRLPLAFQTRDHGRSVAPLVAELMAAHVGRDAAELLDGYEGEVEGMFGRA